MGGAAFLLVVSAGATPAQAGPFMAGDILISVDAWNGPAGVREYTPSGKLVQTITVPTPGDTPNRDIAVDAAGNLQVYNGTFSPYLSTYNPLTGAWQHHTFAGWSTANGSFVGGIAVSGNYAFATDMMTFNGGEPNGIVRFDLRDFSAQRFGSGDDYLQVAAGGNGLLYGLTFDGLAVKVYDPTTMSLLATDFLPTQFSALTADAAGHLFGVSLFDPNIYELDSQGNVLKTLYTGQFYMDDIALAANGGLVVSDGQTQTVLVTNTGLRSFRTFSATAGDSMFVAWVPGSQASAASEPSSLALLLLGIGGLGAYRGWQRRRAVAWK
jgi:hypothetical protein